MELTKNQIAIMKHTVKEKGRNWFGTSLGCTDSNDFEVLVENGLALSRPAPSWSGDDVLYALTDDGKKAIKDK